MKKNIILTRNHNQNLADSQYIDKDKYCIHSVPLIETQQIDVVLSAFDFEPFDWIVFTSSNAVCYFMNQVKNVSVLQKLKVAVIGIRTRETAEAYGLNIVFMPSKYTSNDFINEWSEMLLKEDKQKILLPKSNLARSNIKESMESLGHVVDEMIVYANRLPLSSKEQLIELFKKEAIDTVVFSSPSASYRFFDIINTLTPVVEPTYRAIGPVTQKAIIAQGFGAILPVDLNYTMESMLKDLP